MDKRYRSKVINEGTNKRADKREKAVERPRFPRPRRNLRLHRPSQSHRVGSYYSSHITRARTLGRKDRAESALMEKVGSGGVACIFVPSTSIYPVSAVLAAIRARNDVARLTNEFVLVAKLKSSDSASRNAERAAFLRILLQLGKCSLREFESSLSCTL